jgi:uncharacterized protein (DUF849 family)
MTPYLPITPDQIGNEAIAATEAGTAILHLHARDPHHGKPDQTPEVLGAGASQLRIATQAAAMGANLRVGLEDSLWAGRGKLAKSNAEQVALARKIIEGLGKQVATPDEAREILSLKGGDKVAF